MIVQTQIEEQPEKRRHRRSERKIREQPRDCVLAVVEHALEVVAHERSVGEHAERSEWDFVAHPVADQRPIGVAFRTRADDSRVGDHGGRSRGREYVSYGRFEIWMVEAVCELPQAFG